MSNYSKNKKLIMDYVNGNDLSVDVDTLENDLDFMIAAIDYSGDFNIYKLCSDDIKYDYEMIKFLIERFHNNHEFIIETTLEFLDNCDHVNWYKDYMEQNFINVDVEELEVLITIDKYLPKEFDPRVLEIKVRLETIFSLFRVKLEVVKLKYPEENLDALVGKGFELVEALYPTSYVVKDFFASKILDEIIKREDDTFEKKLHRLYAKIPLNKSSISILIELVNRNDVELANYIIVRQNVFKDYIDSITNIVKNWENYENKLIDEKIYNIIEVIHDYYSEYEYNLTMDEFDTVKYFANLLGLTEQFKRIDPITYEAESLVDSYEEMNFNDKIMLKYLTPIINNIMQGKDIYEAQEDASKKKENTYKVVDSKKKKSNITTFKPRK